MKRLFALLFVLFTLTSCSITTNEKITSKETITAVQTTAIETTGKEITTAVQTTEIETTEEETTVVETTKEETTAVVQTTELKTTEADDGGEEYVWIPQSGKKYHSDKDCSNMKEPSRVTKDYAIEQGYTACKKCW